MKTVIKKVAVLAMLISPQLGFAQGDIKGNGGGEEIEFVGITSELQAWLAKNNSINKLEDKLELNGISGTELFQRFTNAVQIVPTPTFQDAEIKINGKSRVCINNPDNSSITCNKERWNAISGDLKYAIAFHEYLGIAKIETNIREYSQYPISKNIIRYVKVKTKFELGMDPVVAIDGYKIGSAKNKTNGDTLSVYMDKDKKSIHFSFTTLGVDEVIKTIKINDVSEARKANIKASTYKMEILKNTTRASVAVLGAEFEAFDEYFYWCNFADQHENGAFCYFPIPSVVVVVPALGLGMTAISVATFLAGIITTPIDGIITGVDQVTNKTAIAHRKLKRVMNGKEVKMPARSFEYLVEEVKKL